MIAAALALAAAPIVAGLDHVPVAVRDLEAAAADYRRLGFVLKPGRPHANGIRNVHAKFADGTTRVAPRGVIGAESSVFVPPEAAHGLWLELRE